MQKNAYLYNRICELCLGIICFGLFQYYVIAGILSLTEFGIACVAADAFPFLVQIPFLITYLKHGRPFQHYILNPMVNLAGAIVYITTGSIYITNSYSVMTDYLAVGSMFIITGIVYFIDLIYWCIALRKESE